MARIYVLEAHPTSDRPHMASKKFALLVVQNKKAVWVDKNTIKLTTGESWATVKMSFRYIVAKNVPIPQLRPFKDEEWFGMMLHYPPADQSSYAKYNFNRIWGSNT